MTKIHRIKGKSGDPYEVLFVDQHGQLVVALTEWYRVRTRQGPSSTRDTYLACLLPFFAFLEVKWDHFQVCSLPFPQSLLPDRQYAS
jgi:hypothetical protein